MLEFKQLRINGFKSFVDSTHIDIGPGLTGIIGPNGCGKSNILDGLRWAMGEGSAKKMRGDDMNDVIFAGSASRARRQNADVTIVLDNHQRQAPAAYNHDDEIEIKRKIERDAGSTYRINGKIVRARDVQLLFSDSLSGANSPALVSQGRITSIITSKPFQRRQILEDSAGIAGLYTRRHEAELRLRAADDNLLRMDDVLTGLYARQKSLEKQVKSAEKYRQLSQAIRENEQYGYLANWIIENHDLTRAQQAHEQADSMVQSSMHDVAKSTKLEQESADSLPRLREDEAKHAAAYQACYLKLKRVEDKQSQHEQDLKNTQNQLTQSEADYAHGCKAQDDYQAQLNALENEALNIQTTSQDDDRVLADMVDRKDQAQADLTQSEEFYQDQLNKSAQAKADKTSLENMLALNTRKLSQAESDQAALTQQINDLTQNDDAGGRIDLAQEHIQNWQDELNTIAQDISQLDGQINDMDQEISAAIDQRDHLRLRKNDIENEMKAIDAFLSLHDKRPKDSDESQDAGYDHQSVLDLITVKKGFEHIVTKAFGESLNAGHLGHDQLDQHQDYHRPFWSDLSADRKDDIVQNDFADVDGASIVPLSDFVTGPDFLARPLSMIGYVAQDMSINDILALASQLKPGQSIINQTGHFIRWDGYVAPAAHQGAADEQVENHNMQVLIYRNQLDILRADFEKIAAEYTDKSNQCDGLQSNLSVLKTRRADLHDAQHKLHQNIQKSRQDIFDIQQKEQAVSARKNQLHAALDRAKADAHEYAQITQDTQAKLDKLQINDSLDHDLDTLRKDVQDKRDNYIMLSQDLDRMNQDKIRRVARLRAIGDEKTHLQNRQIQTQKHVADLKSRLADLQEKLASLQVIPGDFDDEKQALLDHLTAADRMRQKAADDLAAAERDYHDKRIALKEDEAKLNHYREERAKAIALAGAAQDSLARLEHDIDQKCDGGIHALLRQHKDHGLLRPAPQQDGQRADHVNEHYHNIKKMRADYEANIKNLMAQRNALGAVNLSAENEMNEIANEISDFESERDDLVDAITALRSAIQKLNKQARERLNAAFIKVNQHFKTLFSTLFNGGEAHLKLIESDDPLESGLEIYAQPPGKSLQSLSLLSGGEQTLTALALIFAMFLSNPSPICILDEVDAPLDDGNVDRMCDLLQDMAAKCTTRFFVITHHRLTMARMDRLYGVTMAEKGVSKLVSVDMHQQLHLLDDDDLWQHAS